MKSYQRVLIFLLVALAVTSLLSPWVALLWNSIVNFRPEWGLNSHSFFYIFRRLLIATGVVLLLCCRFRLGIQSPRQVGLGPVRPGFRQFCLGFLVAVASVAGLAFLMFQAEIFTPDFDFSLRALGRSGRTLLAALMIGVFEEIFFRGMIFKGLMKDARPTTAFSVANLFYAGAHFVKPDKKFALDDLDPLGGVRYLIQAFEPFLDWAILPGLCGLFLIGLALSYALRRTGSLYLSIGLHAGWVFGIKSTHHYGNFSLVEPGWLFGSSEPKFISGVVTWLAIAVVGIVIHLMTQKK